MRHARGRRAPVRAAALARRRRAPSRPQRRSRRARARRLAGLLDHDRRRLLAPLAQEEREVAHDVAARDGRSRRPTPAAPRVPPRPRRRHRRPPIARRGRERLVSRPQLLEPRARARRHRPPADEVLDVLQPAHQADQPPSTTTFEPVTYDDASEARKTTAPSASCRVEHAPHRRARRERIEELLRLVVPHARERERVHAHAVLRPVRGEVAREVEHGRLRDRVRNRLEERLAARAAELVEVLHRREAARRRTRR